MRTYNPATGWTDLRVGPTTGYEVIGGLYAKATVATTRRGSMAIGWREVVEGSVGDAEGTSLVRVFPAGGELSDAHALSESARCGEYSNCLHLGVTRRDGVAALYADRITGWASDYALTRYDAESGEWSCPTWSRISVRSAYFSAGFSMAPSGTALVRVSAQNGPVAR